MTPTARDGSFGWRSSFRGRGHGPKNCVLSGHEHFGGAAGLDHQDLVGGARAAVARGRRGRLARVVVGARDASPARQRPGRCRPNQRREHGHRLLARHREHRERRGSAGRGHVRRAQRHQRELDRADERARSDRRRGSIVPASSRAPRTRAAKHPSSRRRGWGRRRRGAGQPPVRVEKRKPLPQRRQRRRCKRVALGYAKGSRPRIEENICR